MNHEMDSICRNIRNALYKPAKTIHKKFEHTDNKTSSAGEWIAYEFLVPAIVSLKPISF